jgi:hypothetical protein
MRDVNVIYLRCLNVAMIEAGLATVLDNYQDVAKESTGSRTVDRTSSLEVVSGKEIL